MASDETPAKRVYIGLGSNLSDPVKQVLRAQDELAVLSASRLTGGSSLYRSTPLTGKDSPEDQPVYINAVVEMETWLPALALLDNLQEIEARHGRDRSGAQWGPRTLDLDLLLYDDQIINTERLVVPHAGLREREFVLVPLFEIRPDLLVPGTLKPEPLTDLMKDLPLRGLEKLERHSE